MASSSSSAAPTSSPTILLFARGILAILDLWPALTIAVREEWGGPDSRAKKTWIASTLVDLFETRAPLLPPSTSISGVPTIDPSSAHDPPLDLDDIGDLLSQIMSDEFDANIEDGSIDRVAQNIVELWRHLLIPPTGETPESVISGLEQRAREATRGGLKTTRGADPEEGDEDDESGSESEDEDGMDVDGDEAPRLVDTSKEKQEPVVDEDGFTLVQKGRRR